MRSPSHSTEEQRRISAIEELDLLDTPREVEFDEIVELAAEMCQTPIGAISLLYRDRKWFKASIGLDTRETSIDTSFGKWAIAQDGPLVVEDATKDSRFQSHPFVAGQPYIRSYAGVPLRIDGGTKVGTLCVADCVPRSFTEAQCKALTVLARQVQTQMQLRLERRNLRSALDTNKALMLGLEARNRDLSEANRQLEHLAVTDPLTGLLNRREFDRALDMEWRRSVGTAKHLSLLMVDADCFKNYNDIYGHLSGDYCLKKVASAISNIPRRRGGIAARFGGEEFVVLLPETDQSEAQAIGESIRCAVKGLALEHRGSCHSVVTVSIGYSTIEAKDELHHAMLTHTADLALYEAKRAGRNCVKTLAQTDRIC